MDSIFSNNYFKNRRFQSSSDDESLDSENPVEDRDLDED